MGAGLSAAVRLAARLSSLPPSSACAVAPKAVTAASASTWSTDAAGSP